MIRVFFLLVNENKLKNVCVIHFFMYICQTNKQTFIKNRGNYGN